MCIGYNLYISMIELQYVEIMQDNALGESPISADVVGNTRTVLAALPCKVVISTMLVILT